jgi:hypothetical protein
MEVVAVGALATGASLAIWCWLRPQAVLDLQHSPADASKLRSDVATIAGILGTAVVLALAAAWLTRRIRGDSVSVGVWWEVLAQERIPKGYCAHAAIRLDGDVTVMGVLRTFTWSDDVSHRDVGLQKPITFRSPGKETIRPEYDHLIVPGTEIRHLAIKYELEDPPPKVQGSAVERADLLRTPDNESIRP